MYFTASTTHSQCAYTFTFAVADISECGSVDREFLYYLRGVSVLSRMNSHFMFSVMPHDYFTLNIATLSVVDVSVPSVSSTNFTMV